jgi:aubergine-like protein
MNEPDLIAGNNMQITPRNKTFPVFDKREMKKWICVYKTNNYQDAEKLYNTFQKACGAYKLQIAEPEWVEMDNRSNAQALIDEVENLIANGDYAFVVYIFGKGMDSFYNQVKIHSLCTNGYVSQVIKAKSLYKNELSVCSKILLQINAKLNGISYVTRMPKEILDRNIMVIGVDSSHIQGKRTGVAMIATLDEYFNKFYNSCEIIKEENRDQIQYAVSTFIDKAVVAYNNLRKEMPKSIIIYRQGVSLQQKEYLKTEINQIKTTCNAKNILFEYILVNTKTTYKFFEKEKNDYKNPEAGLLIMDGITNRNYFEFYIQPQNVTGGSATPSCYHVAYGNMNFPEIIPLLTYYLCHMYSNWQGPVRIPNVLKSAEKLSKMTAKVTKLELNENLKEGQAYL